MMVLKALGLAVLLSLSGELWADLFSHEVTGVVATHVVKHRRRQQQQAAAPNTSAHVVGSGTAVAAVAKGSEDPKFTCQSARSFALSGVSEPPRCQKRKS